MLLHCKLLVASVVFGFGFRIALVSEVQVSWYQHPRQKDNFITENPATPSSARKGCVTDGWQAGGEISASP